MVIDLLVQIGIKQKCIKIWRDAGNFIIRIGNTDLEKVKQVTYL